MAVSFCTRRIVSSRNNFFAVPKRNGYIVLLPEIGENLPEKNPLLKDDDSPEFNNITIEKCMAAIAKQALEFEESIKSIELSLEQKENPDVFKDALHPLERLCIPLEITWGIAKTLYYGNQSVMPTKCYTGIHGRASHAAFSRYTSKPIYELCKKAIANDRRDYTDEQRRVLSKFVLEGRLNGLELTEKKRGQLLHSGLVMQQKSVEFAEKLQVAGQQFTQKITNPDTVKDFPIEFLRNIAPDPAQPHLGPWTVTLDSYNIKMFMEHCPDRTLRWKVWEADVTRASLFNDRMLQNSTPLEEIRYRRADRAKDLGYKTYADLSMETKMAGNVKNLYNVLDVLLKSARSRQEKEIAELSRYATEKGMEGSLKQWDIPYWSRKHCRNVYNYFEERYKPYFPLPKVLKGLYDLMELLFGIQIVESRKVDIWHKDVRFFEIFDLKDPSVEPIASFYLDPYERHNEKLRVVESFGTMMPIKSRSKIANTKAMAALIFNFQPPIDGKPSLLTFRDVQVLFQKFGHALQHLLSRCNYREVSGLSFIEWDAAFISDYFLANWLYETSILQKISGHYDTDEPLPLEMIDTLLKARTHFAGYKLCRELYLSKFDMEMHISKAFWQEIMECLWKQHFVLPLERKDCHVCQFQEVFSENWGAAYYSQLWSQMLAADLFGTFQEAPCGVEQQKEIGNRYRETFLSLSGIYPMSEVFRRFRGRDPSPTALLKNLGLKDSVLDVND